jgi:hypothetical protein
MSGEMADPAPENISGKKSVSYEHRIHHRVNWGYLVIGAAAILAIGYVWANFDLGDDDEQQAVTA